MRSESEILKTINSEGTESIKILVMELLAANIDRSRLKNDNATGDALLRNQGAIQEFKRLLAEIDTDGNS